MNRIILLVALAAVAMTGCKSNAAKSTVEEADSTAVSSQIAYVDLDSLLTNYEMYKEMSEAYATKAKKANRDLESKGRSFEKDVASFQEKVDKGLVTRAQAEQMGAELQSRQQSVMAQRDKVMQDLSEEQQVMMNNVHYNIVEFLKVFNSDYRYGMILTTSGGAPIMNADPRLDITKVVLERLNADYAKQKK